MESSATIFVLIWVSNLTSISMSGVSRPFLNQDIMYHCPVYSIFSLEKRCLNYSDGNSGYTNKGIMIHFDNGLLNSTGVHFDIMMLTLIESVF